MNHTPMEVMLDEQVEKLKAINADLLEALEIVNGWFDEEEGPSPFWPNEEEAQKAYGIATVVREAIKKHKGEA